MIDQEHRLRLRVAIKIMVWLALFAFAYVLLSMFFSDAPNSSSDETLRVAIDGIEEGESRSLLWNGRPVIVYHRSKQEHAQLLSKQAGLRDPESKRSKQPSWAVRPDRSREPAWFVAIASGTDMGCPVEYLAANKELFNNQIWQGGFVDTCRKSRYDLAGRVFEGQQASKNLVVPAYRVDSGELVLGAQ